MKKKPRHPIVEGTISFTLTWKQFRKLVFWIALIVSMFA